MGLGLYNSLGEYCGPDTAYSVFLIVLPLGLESFKLTVQCDKT